MKADGRRWGKQAIREYCHGGKNPAKKGPRDGCAVLWPVWGAVVEYAETMVLIKAGMTPPNFWTKDDWRAATRIANHLERLALDDARSED